MSDFRTVTCVSDLGIEDESVGLVHSIINDLAPEVRVIDLSHQIESGDVRGAALMVARSVPYLSPGLLLASVGSRLERPAIAVSVGEGQSLLLGPDNGVLGAAVAVVGGAEKAVQLTNTEFHNSNSGVLHLARDVLAPVAGHLAAGVELEEMGTLIDPSLLLPSLIPVPRIEDDGSIAAEVIWVNRRGGAQLNIDREILSQTGNVFILEFAEDQRVVKLQHPEDVNPGQLALVDDEYGLLAIATGRDEGIVPAELVVGCEVVVREAK